MLTLFTGAVNGTLAAWSFESSRVNMVYKDEESDIVIVKSLFPYRAFMSGNSRGILCVWSISESKKVHPMVFKISVIDHFSSIPNKPITSIHTVRKSKKLRFSNQNTGLSSEQYRHDEAKRYVELKYFQPVALETLNSLLKASAAATDDDQRGGNNRDHLYAFVATGLGYVQVYHLSELFKVFPVERLNENDFHLNRYEKFRMNIMRKDNLNIDKMAESLLKDQEKLNLKQKIPLIYDNSAFIKQWRAHKDSISSIGFVDPSLDGFTTCSKDKFIRIWSHTGIQWGQFNLLNFELTKWSFPFDWMSGLRRELTTVFEIIEKLEKRRMDSKERERVTTHYLFNNFVLPDLKQKYVEMTGKRIQAKDTSFAKKLEKFMKLREYSLVTQGSAQQASCARISEG